MQLYAAEQPRLRLRLRLRRRHHCHTGLGRGALLAVCTLAPVDTPTAAGAATHVLHTGRAAAITSPAARRGPLPCCAGGLVQLEPKCFWQPLELATQAVQAPQLHRLRTAYFKRRCVSRYSQKSGQPMRRSADAGRAVGLTVPCARGQWCLPASLPACQPAVRDAPTSLAGPAMPRAPAHRAALKAAWGSSLTEAAQRASGNW